MGMFGKLKNLRLPAALTALNLLATDPAAAQTTDAPRQGVHRLNEQELEKLIDDLDKRITPIIKGQSLAHERFQKEFRDMLDDDPAKLELAESYLQQLKEYEE